MYCLRLFRSSRGLSHLTQRSLWAASFSQSCGSPARMKIQPKQRQITHPRWHPSNRHGPGNAIVGDNRSGTGTATVERGKYSRRKGGTGSGTPERKDTRSANWFPYSTHIPTLLSETEDYDSLNSLNTIHLFLSTSEDIVVFVHLGLITYTNLFFLKEDYCRTNMKDLCKELLETTMLESSSSTSWTA